jgi:hypothetical protein
MRGILQVMHTRRVLLLVVLTFIAFAPLIASAQATTTHTNITNNGIPIFTFPSNTNTYADQSGLFQDPSIANAIWADIEGNYTNSTNKYILPWSHVSGGLVGTTGIWDGAADSASFTTGNTSTITQICQDVDSTMGPGTDALSTSDHANTFSSPNNNNIWLYNGSSWAAENAGDNGSTSSNNYHTGGLTCTSYDLPYNTMSADKTTVGNSYQIISGQSVTLAINDTDVNPEAAPAFFSTQPDTASQNYIASTYAGQDRDNLWEYDSHYPDYSKSNQAGYIYFDSGGPVNQCTISASPNDSTLNPTYQLSEPDVCKSWSGPQGGQYTCNTPSYEKYEILNTQKITVSPTKTTKYTYSCTNPNGTTNASVTITVVKQPTANLTASPTSIDLGDPTTLTYTCSANSTAGTITGDDGSSWNISASHLDGSAHTFTVTPSPSTPFSSPASGTTVNYTLKCTGPSGTTPATNGASVHVDAPDINPGSVNPSPNSPAVGANTSFVVSSVANNGGASTSGSFKDLLEVYKGSSTVGQTSTEPTSSFKFSSLNPNYLQYFPTNSSLGAGNSTSDTITGYQFPSGGTWWVRDCANTGSSGNTPGSSYAGNTESNYGNNCTAWKEVDVSAQPTANLTPASATTAEGVSSPSGGSVTLTYTCGASATSGSLATSGTDGPYTISGLTGSVNVTPIWTSANPSTTYTLTCKGPSGTTPATDTSVVAVTPLPDLTITAITPTTVTAGAPTTFSSTVENTGDASSGTTFPVLYQWATSAGGANFATMGTDSSAPKLASNASENAMEASTMDSTFTVPSSKFWVRACANTTNNSSWPVTESNTGNNCNAWTPVTVNPSTPPVTVICGVAPTTGTTATNFVWTASASGGTGTGYKYYWSGTSLNGDTGTPVSTTYPAGGPYTASITVTDSNNNSSGPVTCAGGAGVGAAAVTSVTAPATITSFVANPSTVVCGASAKLTWASSNATSCTGTGFSTGGATNNASGVTITPTSNPSNYQLTCQDAAGDKVYANTSVAIASPQTSISISPASIPAGGKATVTWDATGVQGATCSVTANGIQIASGTGDASGDFSDSASPYVSSALTSPVTYVITCDLTSDEQACINASTVTASAITNVVTSFGNF